MKIIKNVYIIIFALSGAPLQCMHNSILGGTGHTAPRYSQGVNPDIINTQHQDSNEDPLSHILPPHNSHTLLHYLSRDSINLSRPAKRTHAHIEEHSQQNMRNQKTQRVSELSISEALNNEDWNRVKMILAENPYKAYKKNRNNETPLDIAARNGQSHIVETCLYPYIDYPLDIEDEWNMAQCISCKHALQEAIKNGHTQTAVIIIYAPKAQYTMPFSNYNFEYETALDTATQYKDVNAAYGLLQNGDHFGQENPTDLLDISTKKNHMLLAKHLCKDPTLADWINFGEILNKQIDKKKPHIARTLIHHGARVDGIAYTSIQTASENGYHNLVDDILNRASLEYLRNAMFFLAQWGNADVLQKLLDRVGDPNYFRKGNALTYGATHPTIVRTLLQAGCYIDAADPTKGTPLYSALNHNAKTVDKLLKNGANPNYTKKTADVRTSCLHQAKNVQAIISLLQYGASLETRDHNGYKPTHYWSKKTYEYITAILASLRDNIDDIYQHLDPETIVRYTSIALGMTYTDAAETLIQTPQINNTQRAAILLHAITLQTCHGYKLSQFINKIQQHDYDKSIIQNMIGLAAQRIRKDEITPQTVDYLLDQFPDTIENYRSALGDTYMHYLAKTGRFARQIPQAWYIIFQNNKKFSRNNDNVTPHKIALIMGARTDIYNPIAKALLWAENAEKLATLPHDIITEALQYYLGNSE